MNPRPYQLEALEAVDSYLESTHGNPLVTLPTGSGKTVIFAEMLRRWYASWGALRVCILSHRQELLSQAEEKIRQIWPEAPIGVWSAGLKRRESNDLLIAGIQSVHNRAGKFDPFDVVIVDEAHLVPNASDTMYRRFIEEATHRNPKLRVIGFTATPFRLDGGKLHGEGKLFTDVAYDANVKTMIDQGWLCGLRTKGSVKATIDTRGIHTKQGEFVAGELEQRANDDELVKAAVADIMEKGADRRSWLIFTCGVAHAHHVADELKLAGVDAPVIVGTTNKYWRADILRRFSAGAIRAVVNVNCLTTGLDVQRIDLIACLRPTQSTSLWVQMCGRGFRPLPGVIDGIDAPADRRAAIDASAKKDCLILDMGGNCRRHGPLDALIIKTKGSGPAPMKQCPECEEFVPISVMECPDCGYIWEPEPTPIKPKHLPKADTSAQILTSSEPWDCDVCEATATRHVGKSEKVTLQVAYICGNGLLKEWHREWICLEHDGYARVKAERWWERRFGKPVPKTVNDAINSRMFISSEIKEMTASITVKQSGRYTEIVGHKLKNEMVGAIAR